MNKVYLVRHGQTNWNKEGRCQGKTNISLNEDGVNQAKALRDKIDTNNIDICIVSPLNRALETAKIITDNKINLIIDDRIVERGFGTLEGKLFNHEATKNSWDYELDYDEYGIEIIKEVLKRAKNFLDYVNKTYDNKNILIVSHGAFIKALYFNIIGYDEKTDFLSFFPKNGEVLEFEI